MSSRSKKSRSKRWETIDVPAIDELGLLSEDVLRTQPLPEGFCVRFFCHNMRYLYTVASRYVMLTRGVLDYLHDFNLLGPNKSRNKLFLCSQYNRDGTCLNGSYCREIHCTQPIEKAEEAALYSVPSNATGAPNDIVIVPAEEILAKNLNKSLRTASSSSARQAGSTDGGDGARAGLTAKDTTPVEMDTTQSVFDAILASGLHESMPLHTLVTPLSLLGSEELEEHPQDLTVISMPERVIVRHSLHSRWTSKSMYETLPAGVQFCVALPNTPTPVDTYDSGELLVTRGAKEFYEQTMRHQQSTVTMQHCAHYSKNGICCFGEDCQFVHVLHYRPKERDHLGGSGSDLDASSSSGSVASERRSGSGRQRRSGAGGSRETPLCIQVPGASGASGVLSGSASHHSRSSTNSNSRSSSSGPHSGQGSGGPVGSVSMLQQMQSSNCVFVPNSTQWIASPPTQQRSLPPPPFDPNTMQKPIFYQPMHAHPQPQQPQQAPCLPGFQSLTSNDQYTIVSGPNGEFIILPNTASPQQQLPPHGTLSASVSPQPPMFTMPPMSAMSMKLP